MHREILNEMLESERWAKLRTAWTEDELLDINWVWHRLRGEFLEKLSEGICVLTRHCHQDGLTVPTAWPC